MSVLAHTGPLQLAMTYKVAGTSLGDGHCSEAGSHAHGTWVKMWRWRGKTLTEIPIDYLQLRPVLHYI